MKGGVAVGLVALDARAHPSLLADSAAQLPPKQKREKFFIILMNKSFKFQLSYEQKRDYFLNHFKFADSI